MKVWVQLADMFAKAFIRENGESPSILWKQAVWALTDEQIANGLANLGNADLSFPPNLSQFVSACKKQPPRKGWVKSTAIEDKREPGRMPFAEWKRLNGVE
jgi:hypothetical protein